MFGQVYCKKCEAEDDPTQQNSAMGAEIVSFEAAGTTQSLACFNEEMNHIKTFLAEVHV